jgi:hypothetical protein
MPTRDDNGGHMGYDLHWIDGPAPGDAPDEYNRRAHLHVSEPMMAALRQEMERQRMIGDQAGRSLVGEWEEKLSESGQVVTRNELVVALATATNAPAPLNPPQMSDEGWRERWDQWLDFLAGAMNYGGLRVERS